MESWYSGELIIWWTRCITENSLHWRTVSFHRDPTSERTMWYGQIFACVYWCDGGNENVPQPVENLQIVLKVKMPISCSMCTQVDDGQKRSRRSKTLWPPLARESNTKNGVRKLFRWHRVIVKTVDFRFYWVLAWLHFPLSYARKTNEAFWRLSL